ncbi:MAG: adenylate/guanylate cyclase domain-containing protein [Nitrospirota bacterium]
MKKSNNKKAAFVVPLLIIIFFSVLTYINPLVVDEFVEALLVDYRFKIRNITNPPPVPEEVLTVLIDEKSLSEYGGWPWDRKLQAELIEKVLKGGPAAVAVDIFYPDPTSPESDRALADVLETHRGKLVIALSFEVEKDKTFEGEINDVLYDHTVSSIKDLKFLKLFGQYSAHRVLLPPEPIAGSARFGHVNSLSDMDGKVRRENLYLKYGDEYFFSLALKTAALAEKVPFEKISIIGGSGIDMGGTFLPSDVFGRLHINYYGKEGNINHVSAADLLSGRISAEKFRDKIVLIGTSAIATYDLKVTPFSANMPGVEKNATVVANIINGDYIIKSQHYFDLTIVILSGIAALLLGRTRKASRFIMTYLFLLTFILFANQAAFAFLNTRVNLLYPLLTVFSTGIFIVSYRYFIEERRARDIRKMFSSYVTERVVNELIENPEMAKLGGARIEVTVLFSDIRGFTHFAEKYEPEDVVAILNEYLSTMTDIVFRWEGTLDKFIGDAIVAFWGAPMKQENHAELAVRCALDMNSRMKELREKWISEGRASLSVGIGLNSGEVIVGNIGAEGKKMDYTVIGDHVNIGSRVESLTRQFNTDIMMTEMVLQRITVPVESNIIGHISINGVGKVTVKGKEKQIRVYKIESLDDSMKSMITESEKDADFRMEEK